MKYYLGHIFFSLLFIIGLALSNNYLVSTFCFDDDFIELSENIEKDLEEESEEKKEKEEAEADKISFLDNHSYFNWFSNTNARFTHCLKNSDHYFEIPTPPPDFI